MTAEGSGSCVRDFKPTWAEQRVPLGQSEQLVASRCPTFEPLPH